MKWRVWELELTPEEATALMQLANGNDAKPEILPPQKHDATVESDENKQPKGQISLMVMKTLKKGPMNVREVAQAINHDPQKTGAVLTYLKRRGLVDLLPDRKWGLAAQRKDA